MRVFVQQVNVYKVTMINRKTGELPNSPAILLASNFALITDFNLIHLLADEFINNPFFYQLVELWLN